MSENQHQHHQHIVYHSFVALIAGCLVAVFGILMREDAYLVKENFQETFEIHNNPIESCRKECFQHVVHQQQQRIKNSSSSSSALALTVGDLIFKCHLFTNCTNLVNSGYEYHELLSQPSFISNTAKPETTFDEFIQQLYNIQTVLINYPNTWIILTFITILYGLVLKIFGLVFVLVSVKMHTTFSNVRNAIRYIFRIKRSLFDKKIIPDSDSNNILFWKIYFALCILISLILFSIALVYKINYTQPGYPGSKFYNRCTNINSVIKAKATTECTSTWGNWFCAALGINMILNLHCFINVMVQKNLIHYVVLEAISILA